MLYHLKNSLKQTGIVSSLRGFLVNTLFDSSFMLIGVIAGSGFVVRPNLKVILGTMFTCSLSLGMSSGVSIHEAIKLEGERRIIKLENAMLIDLGDTEVAKSLRTGAIVVSVINFLTPLFICTLASSPFLLSTLGVLTIEAAVWISIIMTLTTLWFAGIVMSRNGKGNAVLKGMRIAVLGGTAFLIGYWIQTLT